MTQYAPICSDRQRLLKDWVAAVNQQAKLAKEKYPTVVMRRGVMEEAWKQAENAKSALTQHRKAHGC